MVYELTLQQNLVGRRKMAIPISHRNIGSRMGTGTLCRCGDGRLIAAGNSWKSKNNHLVFLSIKRRKDVMAQLGKRYRCEACGTEILCTKAGDANPVCCPLQIDIKGTDLILTMVRSCA